MGETLLSGPAPRRAAAPTTCSSARRAPERAPRARRAVRRARARPTPRRPRAADTLVARASSRRTWPALLDEIADRRAPGQQLVVASPPASRPRSSSRGCPRASPVVRVMPNTPALVDEGMAAISPGSPLRPTTTSPRPRRCSLVPARCSGCPRSSMDAVTAISGTGPAYIFYVVEAMIEAGVVLGLPRATATELVVQTARTARPRCSSETGEHPTVLREQVTLARRHDRRRAPPARRPQGARRLPHGHRGRRRAVQGAGVRAGLRALWGDGRDTPRPAPAPGHPR